MSDTKPAYGEPHNDNKCGNNVASWGFSWTYVGKRSGRTIKTGNSWTDQKKAEEVWLACRAKGQNPTPIRLRWFAGYAF